MSKDDASAFRPRGLFGRFRRPASVRADAMTPPVAVDVATPPATQDLSAPPPHDIFISYSRADSIFAGNLEQSLRQARFTVWLDRNTLLGGQVWSRRIEQGIDACRWVLVVISPDALASEYVRMEYERALQQGKHVIPLLYRAENLPTLLQRLQSIDFRHTYQEGMDRLDRSLRPLPTPGRITQPRRGQPIEPSEMPRPLSFVGRERERDLLEAALMQGLKAGVCALEGMGGIGKSALAAVVVDRLRLTPAFPGGAAWISCEGLEGEAGLYELWARVALVLGAQGVAQETDATQRRLVLAQDLLARRRTLLALDNIEPGIDAQQIVQTLAVPGHTAVLLTARHHLPAALDREIVLDPLPDPEGEELFTERLQRADATRPTTAERADVPALVAALAGVPLALEVTAAYVGRQRLSLVHVLEEIRQDQLRAAPLADRQHGMQARFARSYAALPAAQQLVFAALSLPEGASFPRAAAEAMSAALPDASDGAAHLIAALVDAALVEALPEERLRLHPFLRTFATEQWQQTPVSTKHPLAQALTTFWLDYTQTHEEDIMALEAEAEGIMGALALAHTQGDHTTLIALINPLVTAWDRRGRRTDEMTMYTWMNEAGEAIGDQRVQRRAIHELAVTFGRQGRNEEAQQGYERALQLAEQLGDLSAQQAEMHGLAALAGMQGRNEEAQQRYERALQLAEQLGDLSAQQAEVHGLAIRAADRGRNEEARQGYERALQLAEQLGDLDAQQSEMRELGYLLVKMGERGQGLAMILRALQISEQMQALPESALNYERLAWVAEANGDTAEAIRQYQEALWRFEQIGAPEAEKVRADMRQLGWEG